ncbi:MAG TPA: zf-TFIIB domain-containing protein [Verrucomicrobiae bacterium]|nr:zf-TFIIB domain-containing protein [Verrucomicrobiae bacterium]
MTAYTLKCPMCGASASPDATRCGHCNSRLATIACPACFGMVFLGAKFCSHCGAAARRAELSGLQPRPCPRCSSETQPVLIGTNHLLECPKCEGIWADADALERLYADREQHAAILGAAAAVPTPLTGNVEVVRYLRCPVCSDLMHRVNFARCSHVVVDVCKPHGTWFDRDELRRIIEFIQAGGLMKARETELRELERRRQRLESTERHRPADLPWMNVDTWGAAKYETWDDALSAVSELARYVLNR